MNPTDPTREQERDESGSSQTNQEQTTAAERPTETERNTGEEKWMDTPDRDADLQKEGNLGNERNRNEPDTEQLPGGSRENLNR